MLVPYSREQRERGSPKQQAKGQVRPRAEKAGPGAQPPPPAGQDSVLGPQGQLSELLCGPSRLWKEHDLLENRDPWLGCERVLQPLTWWRCGCEYALACVHVCACVCDVPLCAYWGEQGAGFHAVLSPQTQKECPSLERFSTDFR